LSANGQNATNSRAGGGAGGSIRVIATTIVGSGTLFANGGAGEPVHGGGGGGGRIALVANTNLFTGTLSAIGGAGWQRGGAGTLYATSTSSLGKVTIDNGGFAGASTPVELANSSHTLEVRGRAVLLTASSELQTVKGLIVRTGSTISTVATNFATMNWQVSGDAAIESGAEIQLSGKGLSPGIGTGIGQGSSLVAGGSGHGGNGGLGQSGTTSVFGGLTYGSTTAPTSFGSGGRCVGNSAGGRGGGALHLTVTGKLQLDGLILADGTTGSGASSGGAAGGSVWLTLGEFAGRGLISANGGNGGMPYGGGGGGGRIAVTCQIKTFTGAITAFGGAGPVAVAGGAGTIYTKLSSAPYADLLVDNGGLLGANTSSSDLSSGFNLIITGGAVYRPTAAPTSLGSVMIGPNSKWLVGNGSVGATITVASNVIVAAGGLISGDGFGFGIGSGPGAGSTSPFGSTGGGHGGFGGRGTGFTNSFTPGGNAYDPTTSPSHAGSGGGSLSVAAGLGGGPEGPDYG
jgi:hypothetical protein